MPTNQLYMKNLINLIISVLLASAPIYASAQKQYPFNNIKLSDNKRIENVISLMTFDEKIDALGNNTSVPRLGIKGSNGVEGLHGVVLGGPTYGDRPQTPTTVFPQSYGLGETWDADLLYRIATYISTENRYLFQNPSFAKSGLVIWTPNADMGRDPRWGRTEECYGEDPYLTSRLVVSFVKGIQGDNPKYWRSASLMKHFFANSNEYGRSFTSSNFSEKLFRDYYSYPFYKGITEGGSQAMMTAYNSYNGTPCIIQPVLRNVVMKEWKFKGSLITDGGAFGLLLSAHKCFDNDRGLAAFECIKAGITKFLDRYKDAVEDAYKRKLITEKQIDDAVKRNLWISLRLGLLDGNDAHHNPYAKIGLDNDEAPWTKPETKALVREATCKSVVLLKNENSILPLDKSKIKKIAVIGERATQVLQDWYSGKPFYTVNVLNAIREEVGENVEVRYVHENMMDSARVAAAWADVAIVCVGNHPYCNAPWDVAPVASEGKEDVDRRSLILDQEDLVMQVHAANPNTVAVLISSFPYAINRIQQAVPAILHVANSSEELGHGVSDVIFGKYNPAGRLTQTWVKDITDLPNMMDYDITHGRTYMYFRGTPLYPFGFGLSYTVFKYSNLSVSISRKDSLKVSFDIANTGTRDGDEVAQLYVVKSGNQSNTPIKQLKSFCRINISRGDIRHVEFYIPRDTDISRIEIGASSADIRLKTEI